MKYSILCIIGLLLLTSGCSEKVDSAQKGKFFYDQILKKHELNQSKEDSSQAEEKTVQMLLQKENNRISIIVKNPKAQEIRSVRSWLAFPAGKLTIKNLNLNTEIFDLAAPNEFQVDKKNGLIQIGLSSTKGSSEQEIFIGSFDVSSNSSEDVLLSCYDYSDSSDSHCMVLDSKSTNLLLPVESIIIPATQN